jgi:hypothetical protein
MYLTGEQRLRVYKGFYFIPGWQKICYRITVLQNVNVITRCRPMETLALPRYAHPQPESFTGNEFIAGHLV